MSIEACVTKRTKLTRWQGRRKISSWRKWQKNSQRGCGANTVWDVAWKCRCCKKWEERLKSSPTGITITVIWKEQLIQEVVTVSNTCPLLAIRIFAYCTIISCYKMLGHKSTTVTYIWQHFNSSKTSLWTWKKLLVFKSVIMRKLFATLVIINLLELCSHYTMHIVEYMAITTTKLPEKWGTLWALYWS